MAKQRQTNGKREKAKEGESGEPTYDHDNTKDGRGMKHKERIESRSEKVKMGQRTFDITRVILEDTVSFERPRLKFKTVLRFWNDM